MSDRLTLTHAIEDAGIERAKAERMASVIFDAIHDEVATKADLTSLRVDLKADLASLRVDLKADIAGVRSELKADIEAVRSELKADVAAVRSELKSDIQAVRANADLIEHRLLTRLGGLMIVVGGVLFAALHYWPPGAH